MDYFQGSLIEREPYYQLMSYCKLVLIEFRDELCAMRFGDSKRNFAGLPADKGWLGWTDEYEMVHNQGYSGEDYTRFFETERNSISMVIMEVLGENERKR
jgi:hypothetical protein